MRKAALLLIACVCAAVPLSATLIVPAEFRQVVAESTLIVRGRVTDVRAVDVRDVGVETVVTVAVENVLKGQSERFVYLKVPGGEIGRYRFVMVSAPVFKTGQRAVLFLKRGADNFWRPFGLNQGVFRIHADPVSGLPVVPPPVVAGRNAPRTGPAERGDPRRKLMPIPEFESLVRLVMLTPPAQAVPRGGR
jgi:hypothetical protein